MKNKLAHAVPLLASLALIFWLGACSAQAASHTWAGVGITGNWSLPANWAANNPPAAGEAAPVSLTFPSGAAQLNNTNNLGGLVVDSLTFSGSGYNLNGSGVGTNLTLHGGGGTVVLNFGNTTNTFNTSLNLILSNNVPVTVNSGGSLLVDGQMLGQGGFTKQGVGAMTILSLFNNTYAGSTFVTAGTLKLDAGYFTGVFPLFVFHPQLAVPGYLEIGNSTVPASVQLLANSQLPTSATLQIDNDGVLDLNNNSTTCGPLVFSGAGPGASSPVAQSGTGTLTLNGDVSGVGGNLTGILSLGDSVGSSTSTRDTFMLPRQLLMAAAPRASSTMDYPGLFWAPLTASAARRSSIPVLSKPGMPMRSAPARAAWQLIVAGS